MKIFKNKLLIILMLIASVLTIRHIYFLNTAFYIPDYKAEDISHLLTKKELTDSDYSTIFINTGVSPAAARELILEKQSNILTQLNKLYFKKPEYDKNYICFPFTIEERNVNQHTPIVNLKKGDILVTFNTATLDWRHGHIGLVTDKNGVIMLEHMAIGDTSCLTHTSSWVDYPAFAVLRYPDFQVASAAADYAIANLIDIKYSVFAGIIKKDKSGDKAVDSSHCSHIVWQAYKSAGVDIDSNGGLVVTPKDIALCDKLKVVQIYGINPQKYADRVLKN